LHGLTVPHKYILSSQIYIIYYNGDLVAFKFNLPFKFGQPRRIPETFGKRIAVDFQFGYLQNNKYKTLIYYNIGSLTVTELSVTIIYCNATG